MPTKEELLAKHTYTDVTEVEKRVFYTLIGEDNTPLTPEKLRDYRNSKAIAQLFKVLVETGTVSDDQLDDILLQVALLSARARKSHQRIPIDPTLRAQAEEIFARYSKMTAEHPPDTRSYTEFEDPSEAIRVMTERLRPTAMKTLSDLLKAYDRGELSVTLQKQLISTLKKTVKQEGF